MVDRVTLPNTLSVRFGGCTGPQVLQKCQGKIEVSGILYIDIYVQTFTKVLGKYSKKKNVYKAVRLTAWVDPPSPSPEAVRKM